MDIEKDLMVVMRHQSNPHLHPYTCGGCRGTTTDREAILIPMIDEESNCKKLYFRCSFDECPYTQDIDPEMMALMRSMDQRPKSPMQMRMEIINK